MAEIASIYDVAVIGGGVVGCGVARACALAGRKTVLIEREAALASSPARGGNTGIACTAADCEPGTVEHSCLERAAELNLDAYDACNVPYAATGAVYDRQVAMLTRGRQFMLAKTTVFVTDAAWQRAAEDERVPVGALFRHMREMPAFALHSTGSGPGYFWRVYSLRASGMTCEINETFRDEVLAEEITLCAIKQRTTPNAQLIARTLHGP